jgi:hypothetical protein
MRAGEAEDASAWIRKTRLAGYVFPSRSVNAEGDAAFRTERAAIGEFDRCDMDALRL